MELTWDQPKKTRIDSVKKKLKDKRVEDLDSDD